MQPRLAQDHGLSVSISKVRITRMRHQPSFVTYFLLSSLSRIECYRYVSFDQDDTGHKAGSSHSRTRNQCHALQQILPPGAHYLLRVYNQGKHVMTP